MRYDSSVPDLAAAFRAECSMGADCVCAQDAEARLAAGEDERAILLDYTEISVPVELIALTIFAGILGLQSTEPDADEPDTRDTDDGRPAFDLAAFLAATAAGAGDHLGTPANSAEFATA